MQRSFWAFAAAFTLALSPSASARAATIDTTGSDTGTIIQFGAPNTATYGQTFIAPGSVLDSFSLFLRDRVAGTSSLDLRGYVATWNGLMASSILYESSTRTMRRSILSIANLPGQVESNFGMPHGIDQISGEFAFLNNGNSPSEWTTS